MCPVARLALPCCRDLDLTPYLPASHGPAVYDLFAVSVRFFACATPQTHDHPLGPSHGLGRGVLSDGFPEPFWQSARRSLYVFDHLPRDRWLKLTTLLVCIFPTHPDTAYTSRIVEDGHARWFEFDDSRVRQSDVNAVQVRPCARASTNRRWGGLMHVASSASAFECDSPQRPMSSSTNDAAHRRSRPTDALPTFSCTGAP